MVRVIRWTGRTWIDLYAITMIIIHSDNNFSVTNFFQFDYDLIPVDRKNISAGVKKTGVIRNIKKLFNFDCKNYITLNKGDRVKVIMPNKAYECEVVNVEKLIIIKELDIDIFKELKKIKNGI